MKFTIKDFRAISLAATEEARLTMIMGGNMAGKTTIINGLASALLGDRRVYGATKSTLATTLIAPGAKHAAIKVEFPNGAHAAIQWPGDITSHGLLPETSDITLGRVDPCRDYDRQEWATFVREIAGARIPDEEELASHLGEPPEDCVDDLGELMGLAQISWDDAAEHAANFRKATRRRWERAIGGTWGDVSSKEWVAEGFVSEFDLSAAERELKGLIEDLARTSILSEVGRHSEVETGTKIEGLNETYKGVSREMTEVETKIDKVRQEQAVFADTDPMSCPHCGELTVVASGELIKVADAKPRSSSEWGKLVKAMGVLVEKQARGHKQLGLLEGQLKAEKERMAQIKEATKAAKIETGDEGREAKVARRMSLEREMDAYKTTMNSRWIYEEWKFWDKTTKALAPSGLRLQATTEALGYINERIGELAGYLFPGDKVELTTDFDGITITFNGMSYDSLTWNGDPNSYGLRTQYLFQIMQAQRMGKDSPVLLDRVDTLERNNVIGLLKLLINKNMVAVLARTANQGKPDTDKLAKAGKGITYWLENGKLERL